MADEANELERLVAQRIRERLDEGGLQGLIEARQQLEAQLKGSGRLEAQLGRLEAQFGDPVGLKDSADVVVTPDPVTPDPVTPDPAVLVLLQTAFPGFAKDIKGRSPRDIKFAVELYSAFVETLVALLMLYEMVHQQPPTETQIIEIFHQTMNVVHQIINMAPPGPR